MGLPLARSVAVPTVVVLLCVLTFLGCLYLDVLSSEVAPIRYRPSRMVSRLPRKFNLERRPVVGLVTRRPKFPSESDHGDVETSQSRPTLSGRSPSKFSSNRLPSSEPQGQNKRHTSQRISTANDSLLERRTYPRKSVTRSETRKQTEVNEESIRGREKPKPKNSTSSAGQGAVDTSNISNQSAEAIEKSCTPHKQFFNCCRPVTLLASVQGSGNTWVRHLLEEATGYYTGSIYNDSALKESGFKGESVTNGTVLVVKTHRREKNKLKFDRVILLTRSPSDCMLAEFKRVRGGGHLGYPDKKMYEKDWAQFFMRYSSRWQLFHEHWYSRDLPMLVVRYEDLKTDLRQQLKRMVKFLDVPITEEKLDCVVENSEGKFHRKSQTGGSADIDPFTDVMKATVEELVQEEELHKKAWEKRMKHKKALSISQR